MRKIGIFVLAVMFLFSGLTFVSARDNIAFERNQQIWWYVNYSGLSNTGTEQKGIATIKTDSQNIPLDQVKKLIETQSDLKNIKIKSFNRVEDGIQKSE